MKIPTDKEIYEMSKRNPRLAARMLQQQKKMMAAEEGKNGPPKNEPPPQAEMEKNENKPRDHQQDFQF